MSKRVLGKVDPVYEEKMVRKRIYFFQELLIKVFTALLLKVVTTSGENLVSVFESIHKG
jgi:hypothetical protein